MLLFAAGSPPSPSLPYSINVGSTWVKLGWSESSCDGGHGVTEFILRYQKEVPDYYVSSYVYVYGLSPTRLNYTIHNLESETSYKFSVQALSTEFQPSDFSDERVITTLKAGEQFFSSTAGIQVAMIIYRYATYIHHTH